MKKRIIKVAALLIVVILLSTSCWDNNEMDTISIITGVAVDSSDKEGYIDLTTQSGKPSKTTKNGSEEKDSPFIIMESTDKTVFQAIEQFRCQSSREPFFPHNQVIIFGMERAKGGIFPYIDYFIRSYSMRMEVLMFVAKERGGDILKAKVDSEELSANALVKNINNKEKISDIFNVTLMDFVQKMLSPVPCAVLPIVELIENKDEHSLSVSDLAVLKKDKVVGTFSNLEVCGYLWITGKVKDQFIEVHSEDGIANLEFEASKIDLKPKIDEDGKLFIELNIYGNIFLRELSGFDGTSMDDVAKILPKLAKEKIDLEVKACSDKAKELNTDALDFGNLFYRYYNKKWKELEQDWDEHFKTVEIKIKTELSFIDVGEIKSAVVMKEES